MASPPRFAVASRHHLTGELAMLIEAIEPRLLRSGTLAVSAPPVRTYETAVEADGMASKESESGKSLAGLIGALFVGPVIGTAIGGAIGGWANDGDESPA
jgi:hypothetical protein